jgi:hypothetical protein
MCYHLTQKTITDVLIYLTRDFKDVLFGIFSMNPSLIRKSKILSRCYRDVNQKRIFVKIKKMYKNEF